ncbi:MAG: ATP phosphoribosyltransferase regulatory subunit, partial [Anaeromyxobacteraceae bacterium]|nr:ATP phosphoribosyltransferase regulatory subunit [Anaeromyxobacteraceae bacterium]
MLDLSLPTGLRDLLPDHSAHLAELSGRLQEVFAGFGYRRLFLPTLERLEVVERGLSAAALADVMKFVEPGSGEVVAIRP